MNLRIGNTSDFVLLELPVPFVMYKNEAPYDWKVVIMSVCAGAWTSRRIRINLTATEIMSFLESFAKVVSEMKGMAKLESMEDWIELECKFDITGKMEIRGTAKDSDNGNRLKFEIQTDQSFISGVPKQIEAYLASRVVD